MASEQRVPINYDRLRILPCRDIVLFPHAIQPLIVGRNSSLRLVDDLKEEEKYLGIICQRDPRIDNPQAVDLFQIGTVAFVQKIVKLPSESLYVFVEGHQRIAIEEVTQVEPFMRARVKPLQDVLPAEKNSEFDALVRSATSLFQQVVHPSVTLSDDLQTVVMNIDDPSRLSDFIAANLASLSSSEKQELLESLDLKARLERLSLLLARESELLRELHLRRGMEADQNEVGEAYEQQKNAPPSVKDEQVLQLLELLRSSTMEWNVWQNIRRTVTRDGRYLIEVWQCPEEEKHYPFTETQQWATYYKDHPYTVQIATTEAGPVPWAEDGLNRFEMFAIRIDESTGEWAYESYGYAQDTTGPWYGCVRLAEERGDDDQLHKAKRWRAQQMMASVLASLRSGHYTKQRDSVHNKGRVAAFAQGATGPSGPLAVPRIKVNWEAPGLARKKEGR
jgi:Lon protease-like protein